MKRVRLVQMVLTPTFVYDDEEHLVPLQVQPIVVTAADWPTYSTEGYARDLAALQEQVDAQQATPSTDT